jgi:dihydrolipoamide dehydrogenase
MTAMVMGSLREEAEVAIVGGGPGGYVAAIRAADLGKEVVLVEERDRLGGVCLLEGCIPSKALINAVEIIQSAREAEKMGLTFKDLAVDPNGLRDWTKRVVDGLSKGVDVLLKKRGVEVVKGRARLVNNKSLQLEGGDVSGIDFRDCILATGSRAVELPAAVDLPVWTSKEALELREIPERLLVIGGGYIGLEMGSLYAGLGSKVTVVEFMPSLLTGPDPDLTQVVVKSCEKRFESIYVESKVVGIEKTSDGFVVEVDHKGESVKHECDRVLVSVGRRPNSDGLGLENTEIKLDDRGFVQIDEECRTAEEHIYAIGDITPGPMLAHKASREAKVAAEVIAQHHSAFDNRAIPAVVFTDPEIAWAGITEKEAGDRGMNVKVGRFPLRALGRARTMGRTEGFAKVISDAGSGLVLGVGLVGPHASDVISEGTLALEMGATLEDLLVTIHPHPTISEAIMEAAEVASGSPVHILPPKSD